VARAEGEAPLSVSYRLLARLEVDEGKLERARLGLLGAQRYYLLE
jgi:hypothetical protein